MHPKENCDECFLDGGPAWNGNGVTRNQLLFICCGTGIALIIADATAIGVIRFIGQLIRHDA